MIDLQELKQQILDAADAKIEERRAKRRVVSTRWRKKNPKKWRKIHKKWIDDNPEKTSLYNRRYREKQKKKAREQTNSGSASEN